MSVRGFRGVGEAPFEAPSLGDVARPQLPDEDPDVVVLLAADAQGSSFAPAAGFGAAGATPSAAEIHSILDRLSGQLHRYAAGEPRSAAAREALVPADRQRVAEFTDREARMWARIADLLGMRDEILSATTRAGKA